MVATIVLNSSNVVEGSNNNTLVYKFPSSVSFPHHEIAVQSISMYYSWANINATPLANNTFSYTWVVGATTTTYTITLPDGLYEIKDINNYLQFEMIANNTYLINSVGQNVYYAEILVNPTRYAVQINTYAVPTSLPATFTAPAGFVGFPTTTFNPVITLPANINKIMGFTAGFATAVNTGVGTTLSNLSSTAPQVQPNSSIYFTSSNIQNNLANPSSVLYSLSSVVAFGEQINEYPPQFAWNKLIGGTYNELRLKITGTNFSGLEILDPNMTIVLVIRDTKDMGLKDILNMGGK